MFSAMKEVAIQTLDILGSYPNILKLWKENIPCHSFQSFVSAETLVLWTCPGPHNSAGSAWSVPVIKTLWSSRCMLVTVSVFIIVYIHFM